MKAFVSLPQLQAAAKKATQIHCISNEQLLYLMAWPQRCLSAIEKQMNNVVRQVGRNYWNASSPKINSNHQILEKMFEISLPKNETRLATGV
jgi:hypothetical protein